MEKRHARIESEELLFVSAIRSSRAVNLDDVNLDDGELERIRLRQTGTLYWYERFKSSQKPPMKSHYRYQHDHGPLTSTTNP